MVDVPGSANGHAALPVAGSTQPVPAPSSRGGTTVEPAQSGKGAPAHSCTRPRACSITGAVRSADYDDLPAQGDRPGRIEPGADVVLRDRLHRVPRPSGSVEERDALFRLDSDA